MPNTILRLVTYRGIQYMYDDLRLKMMSIPKVYLRAGIHRRTDTNEWLHLEDGQPAMTVGDGLQRQATLIGLTMNCETPATWTVFIHAKGNPVPLTSLSITAGTYNGIDTIDVDVGAGTIILFKVEGNNIPFPRVMLELAWRL